MRRGRGQRRGSQRNANVQDGAEHGVLDGFLPPLQHVDAIARDVLGNLIVPEVLIDVDKAAAEVGRSVAQHAGQHGVHESLVDPARAVVPDGRRRNQ